MPVPNQKIVIIKKDKYTDHFLQIGISEWQNARLNMNYGTFCLYLYLAGNMDGFNLELSKEAFENATGFKKTTYHDAIKNLERLGYLVHAHGNRWLFYTTPVRFGDDGANAAKTDFRTNGIQAPQKRLAQSAQPNDFVRANDTEIDKIDNINKTDKEPDFRNSLDDAVTDKEVEMYLELDTLFTHNVYSAEDEEIIGDLLENGYYWTKPKERIKQMTAEERKLMQSYYEKYYEYI